MADPQHDNPNEFQNAMQFSTTHWSLVAAAGRRGTIASNSALERLCKLYWPPLYAYVRRRVPDLHEAQDLTQAFFERLLDQDYLADADPQRGRFRAFLLTAFKHFLSKEWEKVKAQKRGGGRTSISLDFQSADSRISIEPASDLTAEQIYDRQWAVTLLGQIMERLENEFVQSGKAEQFAILKAFIIGEHSGTTYHDAALELSMTAGAAKMAASRMRHRYRELLREEIAQAVATPEDVDDEIRKLFESLGS